MSSDNSFCFIITTGQIFIRHLTKIFRQNQGGNTKEYKQTRYCTKRVKQESFEECAIYMWKNVGLRTIFLKHVTVFPVNVPLAMGSAALPCTTGVSNLKHTDVTSNHCTQSEHTDFNDAATNCSTKLEWGVRKYSGCEYLSNTNANGIVTWGHSNCMSSDESIHHDDKHPPEMFTTLQCKTPKYGRQVSS